MRFLQRHAALLFALFGGALIASYLLFRQSPTAEAAIYMSASLGGFSAVFTGLRACLRGRAASWRPFVFAFALFSLGDLFWCLNDILGFQLPTPYLSDAVYLAAYPLFAWALVRFAGTRSQAAEPILRQVTDAALIFVAAFSATWFLALDHIVDHDRLPAGQLFLTTAYPSLDLVLLALAARFAFTPGRCPLSYRLIVVGFFSMFVGDLAWRLGVATGSYQVSSWINTLFMAAYVMWGAALLHPSIGDVERFGRANAAQTARAAWRRVALLAAASCVAPIVLILSRGRINDDTDVVIFALVVSALPLLSLVSIGDMLRALLNTAADRDLIIDASPVPICVIDRNGFVHVWNRAAEAASGYSAPDVIGHRLPLLPAEDSQRLGDLYAEALSGVPHERIDAKVMNSDGRPIDVRVSNAPLRTDDGRIVALFEDVTREREREREISFLAWHDPLTGLPNRRRFEEDLADAAKACATGGRHLVLVDIDHFKALNDQGGHQLGDRVLRELATLLRTSVREQASVARLSGDEFAVIVHVDGGAAATKVALRLIDVARSYRVEHAGTTYDVSLSAGLYTLRPNDTADLALARADEALYRAKENGKNRLETWKPRMNRAVAAARTWSPQIKDALRADRVDVYLQPIVSLADESPAFFEALCRLRRADGSVLPASEWVTHAERLGAMPSIDFRMIEKVEELLGREDDLRVFVNISPSSFRHRALLDRLEAALLAVSPGSLGIEITEHTAVTDLARTSTTLSHFRNLGALVAIDDFGLGFTSFAELATLPCDIVKIPGTFAQAGANEDDGTVVAAAITRIAHHYDKRVVIEGVETESAANRAKLIGIEYAQGWHYGRPEPPLGARPHQALATA